MLVCLFLTSVHKRLLNSSFTLGAILATENDFEILNDVAARPGGGGGGDPTVPLLGVNFVWSSSSGRLFQSGDICMQRTPTGKRGPPGQTSEATRISLSRSVVSRSFAYSERAVKTDRHCVKCI